MEKQQQKDYKFLGDSGMAAKILLQVEFDK